MVWGAAWMCKYDSSACGAASRYWDECMRINNIKYALGYDWDTVLPGAAALLVTLKLGKASEQAAAWLDGYVLAKWEDTTSLCPKESYANVCYTPKGLAYYADWGTLRGTANMAFIATLMGKHGAAKEAHMCWAKSQLQYMLGTSSQNSKSYVIGYGAQQAATRPHHRGAACARSYKGSPRPNKNGTCTAGEGEGATPCCDVENFMADRDSPILLKGALVGGPDQSDEFPNIRNDYKRSEVALDYQAGFTGAVAGLAEFAKQGKLGGCGSANLGKPAFKRIADYSLCGGKGNACPSDLGGSCTDAPWPGYGCAPGQVCIRDNEWAWVCKGAVPQ